MLTYCLGITALAVFALLLLTQRYLRGGGFGSRHAIALTHPESFGQMEYVAMAKKPAPKQTSSKVSTVASGILSGKIKNPTKAQMKSVAASALSQDQTKGQGKKK